MIFMLNTALSRNNIPIEIRLQELDEQIAFQKTLDLDCQNMISIFIVVSSRDGISLQIKYAN